LRIAAAIALASALVAIFVHGIATFGRSDHSIRKENCAMWTVENGVHNGGVFKGGRDAFHLQPVAMLIDGI
jgi:hypothetical protein